MIVFLIDLHSMKFEIKFFHPTTVQCVFQVDILLEFELLIDGPIDLVESKLALKISLNASKNPCPTGKQFPVERFLSKLYDIVCCNLFTSFYVLHQRLGQFSNVRESACIQFVYLWTCTWDMDTHLHISYDFH